MMAQENLERHQKLLGGIVATLQVGNQDDIGDLIHQIRGGINLSQLFAHVKNAVLSSHEKQKALSQINFIIDDGHELPSPHQILNEMQPVMTNSGESSTQSESDRLPY